jgi:ribonuclease HI
MKIYTDGSGKTGKYAYLVDEPERRLRIFEKKGITNNEAEYMALIQALEDNSDADIEIFSDSELMVKQMKGEYAIKEERLRELAQKALKLCEGRKVTFTWVPRGKNKVGKILG